MTRKLGYWETIKTLMHDLFAGNDITVIALHFKGMIQSGLCKRALQLSFERHPLLRATIHQDNTDGYQFQLNVDFAAIPFTIIQQTYPEQSISLIEAEMKSLFPKEKYLWRVTLLENTPKQECYLLLTFHHAISDATAIFYFIHETLTAYSALEKNREPSLIPLPIVEPQEKWLPNKTDWENYLARATQHQAVENPGWKFNALASLEQRTTRLIIKRLPLELIQRLEQRCRQKGVSLNALLNAITLKTKQQLDRAIYKGTVCTWANTRGYCQPPVDNEHFGYFVNFVATQHANINEKTDVWELAADYYSQLKTRLPELSFFPSKPFTLQHVMASYNMQGLAQTDHFLYDFALSYLPKMPLSTHYGTLELLELNVAVNICSGFVGLVLEIFTFADHIAFVCSYVEPLLDKTWVENFMDQFQQNIIELTSD